MYQQIPRRTRRWLISLSALGCLAGFLPDTPQQRFITAAVGAALPVAIYLIGIVARASVASIRNKNWRQFSLRGLLLLTAIFAVGFATWDRWLGPARDKRQFIAAVNALGGAGGLDSESRISFSLRGTTDDDLAYLTSLPARHNVAQISLDRPLVTDSGIGHLAQFPNITAITLIGCRITDNGLTQLQQLSDLRGLHITNCPGITDAGVAWLEKKQRLRMLNLMNTSVTAKKIDELRKALPYCDVVQSHP